MDLEDIIQRVSMLETCVTGDVPFWETIENRLLEDCPAYVLGKKFTKEQQGLDELKDYVRSRFWFTYRKNFAPIGGTGPESDQGWGCMLRCAQMLLGETLLRRHIGRHYKWKVGVEPSGDYERILRMFFDEKTALYSIHQIAQMGVSEGKAVGEWFGPNTAAQVIKKLAVFDAWSNVAVHVAMDNIVVVRDVQTMATIVPPTDAVKLIMADGNVDESHLRQEPVNEKSGRNRSSTSFSVNPDEWRPLLLIIPLRLGLRTINKCYLGAIQEVFKLDSCVGIIGGRPNHALYFLGIAGQKVFFFSCFVMNPEGEESDVIKQPSPESKGPSTSSPRAFAYGFDDGFSQLEELEPLPSSTSNDELKLDDSTYHCQMLLHIDYDLVDPSLALAFFCETAEEFDKLTVQLREKVFPASSPPLFELLEKRPSYWPPFEPYVGVKAKIEMNEFDDMGAPNYDIDDGFELLEE
ncbi:unnamed protein product [Caenorhabditis auriculariae]|uniref:Cysteine protease n=1 Tax=Caenorhabditis auriculariae TaxID=2777116 RepID=A0A8S1GUP0_9PELO|nr:unnamed protein product [Caenorhabditis auriculariae]